MCGSEVSLTFIVLLFEKGDFKFPASLGLPDSRVTNLQRVFWTLILRGEVKGCVSPTLQEEHLTLPLECMLTKKIHFICSSHNIYRM